ncbi:RASA4 [Symbiodinium necroappetens]|uniref:RASA4 protein n=1 Tax=Symbiodinium necroappetens TaxID=1628268 RepID=A0A812JDT5_9DINO|nr:RASA4 [Symbiodinium necroappetens]
MASLHDDEAPDNGLDAPLLERPSFRRSEKHFGPQRRTRTSVVSRFGRVAAEFFSPPVHRSQSRDSESSTGHTGWKTNQDRLERIPISQSLQELLTGSQHNEETVGSYATLHLAIHSAKNLLAMDASGTSDPYIEIYVNDVQRAKTKTVKRTLNPTFAFEEEIAIWSPFSIVTLRAVDKDMLTKDDPIGFVDFCVADLHPNGEEVRGQLEIRKMEHFEGTAKRRFLKHRRRRDDTYDEDELQQSPEAERDFDDVEDDGTLSFAALMRKKGLSRSMSKAAETMVKAAEMAEKVKPTFVKTLQTSVANVKPPRPAMCCGGLNGEKDETSGFLHWRKKRLNAGEIDISMRLETIMQPSYPDHEVPKHELLYTAVFEPERIQEVVKDAEWFACCFPMPSFQSAEQLSDKFSVGAIKSFWEDLLEALEQLLQVFVWPIYNVFLLIVGWYYWPLSFGALAFMWLWFFCFAEMICISPLVVLACFHALRNRSCSNFLFAHPKVAPLNEQGLKMVTFLSSSKAMGLWLKRLVKDQGGWIDKPAGLKEFAKRTHKDGQPAPDFANFDDLLRTLRSSTCSHFISWHRQPTKCRYCEENKCDKGNCRLEFWGDGAVCGGDASIEEWQLWKCCGRKCKNKRDDEPCCPEGRDAEPPRLHVGCQRYRCPCCAKNGLPSRDICGACVHGSTGSMIMHMAETSAAKQLPIFRSTVMKAIKEVIYDSGPMLEHFQDVMKRALRVLEHLRTAKNLDKEVEKYSVYTSITLHVLKWVLGEYFVPLLALVVKLTILVVGTMVVLLNSAPLRRLRTAELASRRLHRCQKWRRRGRQDCPNWKFFTPDSDSQPALRLPIKSFDTIGEEFDQSLNFPMSPYGKA